MSPIPHNAQSDGIGRGCVIGFYANRNQCTGLSERAIINNM